MEKSGNSKSKYSNFGQNAQNWDIFQCHIGSRGLTDWYWNVTWRLEIRDMYVSRGCIPTSYMNGPEQSSGDQDMIICPNIALMLQMEERVQMGLFSSTQKQKNENNVTTKRVHT